MSPRRAVAVVVALVLALGTMACSGGGEAGGDRPDGTGGATTTSATTAPSTTTTSPEPVELGRSRELALEPGQCFAPTDEDDPVTPTTAGGALRPAEEPDGEPVRVLDCGAAHEGQVYEALCLAGDPDGRLQAGDCPGEAELTWPGTREVRQAAVRLCLSRFEDHFGEPYATSARVTAELVPDQGAWEAGGRRVVCAVRP